MSKANPKIKLSCMLDEDFLMNVKRLVVWAQIRGDDISLTSATRLGLERWMEETIGKHGDPPGPLKPMKLAPGPKLKI